MAITTPQHIEEAIEDFKEEVNTNVVKPKINVQFTHQITTTGSQKNVEVSLINRKYIVYLE